MPLVANCSAASSSAIICWRASRILPASSISPRRYQARLAVVGAGRHRPLPRQVRGCVVAAGFEIRDLHFGASRV
jgi:hypothetical protein